MSNSSHNANSPFGTAPTPEAAHQDGDAAAALRDRFAVIATLSQSATDAVYLARDLGRRGGGADAGLVRLRVLSRSAAGDGGQVKLFRLEAGVAAKLSHKNILKSSAADKLNGVHFRVTAAKPGLITLREHLKRQGWLEVAEAQRLGQQVADALEHAHGLGVLHLSLEPEKVLLSPDGTAFVSGFGIGGAKDLAWAHQERSRGCAARYVSPEQVRGLGVDRRTDLYLLGLILFEMLADRAPFESEDQDALRLKHLNRAPQPPHLFRPELSRALSQLVMDLLGKEPGERPDSVGAFKAALGRALPEGFIAGERDEEPELYIVPALPCIETALGLPDWQPAPEEDQSPEGAPLVVAAAEPDFPADDVAPADGATVIADEATPGPDLFYQPDSPDDSDAESISESDDAHAAGDPVAIDPLAAPPQEARDEAPGEPVTAGPLLLPREHGGAGSRRWLGLALALLLGGGLFWAVRAARLQNQAPVRASDTVAQAPDSNGSAALPAGTFIPAPEPVTPATAELPAQSTPPGPAVGEKSVNREQAPDVVAPDRPAKNIAEEGLLPPKRLALAPPSTALNEPVMKAGGVPPADFSGSVPGQPQAGEPPPAPEQSVKEAPPAPKVIRRSGDVLQNTAIVRPMPVYPEAARAADVKGAVTVEVTIDEEGNVIAARPISGPEALRGAAVAAARRWKWLPTRVDRNRARVVGTITMNFKK